MKMKRNIYIAFLSIVLFFTSCAMEEAFEPEVPEVETELPDSVFFILADPAPLTRVTYAGDGLHADFEKEDLVGCFALNYDQESKIFTAAEGEGFKPNSCYRVSVHTNITTGEDRRFLSPVTAEDDINKTADRYLFYYPYDSKITSLDQLKAYRHSVRTNQNSRDSLEVSDLLWDICTPDDDLKAVYVEMDHAMAQIIVEVESGLIKEGTVPSLLNIPTTVSKLDLVKPDLATMTEDMKDPGLQSYVLDSESKDDITMWEFGYATSGNFMFRAAVPANHTMPSGSLAIQITKPDGTPAKYRLSKALNFEPGKNYLMTLVKERETTTPGEVGDDDTWVYDVLDPETMEPVGLLCREYVRYQPGVAMGAIEYITGVGYDRESGKAVTSGFDTKYVNSQAWVFYKMKPGSSVPDLNTGQVLQFLYDVRIDSHKSAYGYIWNPDGTINKIDIDPYVSLCWPDPHMKTYGSGSEGSVSSSGGVFTPLHGHQWVTAYTDGGLWCGQSYQPGMTLLTGSYDGDVGNENSLIIEHDMHGGIIKWGKEAGNTHFSIIDYSLPTAEVKNGIDLITNQLAHNNGHIAITDSGDAFVSYEDISSVSHKIGVFSPRYLVDRRVGRNRNIEERLYPIVKIGYNQFWMSLSLRASTLNDGTPLVNFNSSNPGEVTYDCVQDKHTPGFVYYSTTNADGYNPYYQLSIDEREDYKLSVLYNFASVISAKMLPLVIEGQPIYYYFANTQSISNMYNYLGVYPSAKIMTRRVRTRTSNAEDESKMSLRDTYLSEAYESKTLGWYMANVCGFDLRVSGAYYQYIGFSDIGTKALMWCVDDNVKKKYLELPHYGIFGKNPDMHGDGGIIQEKENEMFLPIRFFMKFNGQADSEVDKSSISLSSLAKGLATKASSAPVESRDVYVGLELVEEEQ